MKFIRYSAALVLVVCAVSVCFSQEDTIVLNHQEVGDHQRPLVRFIHEEHAAIFNCSRCHHVYDKYGVNVGGEEQACSECHGANKATPIPLVRAFHVQCKKCHSVLLAKGRESGPVMCGQCHVRKAE